MDRDAGRIRRRRAGDEWDADGLMTHVWLCAILISTPVVAFVVANATLPGVAPPGECEQILFGCVPLDRLNLPFLVIFGFPFYLLAVLVAVVLTAILRLSVTFRGYPPFAQAFTAAVVGFGLGGTVGYVFLA